MPRRDRQYRGVSRPRRDSREENFFLQRERTCAGIVADAVRMLWRSEVYLFLKGMDDRSGRYETGEFEVSAILQQTL